MAGQYVDAEQFIARGWTGEYSNIINHGYPDMVAAVVDNGGFADKPCFTMEADTTPNTCGAGLSRQRIIARWDCDGGTCTELADNDVYPYRGSQGTSHGTTVTSALLADYNDCQGYTRWLQDQGTSGCTEANPSTCDCHSAAWQEDSSAAAQEAHLIYYSIGSGGGSTAKAFDSILANYNLDVLNHSQSNKNPSARCKPKNTSSSENNAENLYDDGVFVVNSSGNSDPGTGCTIGSPADVQKVWTATSVNIHNSCTYSECFISTGFSRTGGMTVNVKADGSTTTTVSIVDSATPHHLTHLTRDAENDTPEYDYGKVKFNPTSGSSIAAPVTTSLAILVKEAFLRAGKGWINYPGRLHSVMMAMHDRHWAATKAALTTQRTSGTHDIWGLGRIKLRLFQNPEMPIPFGWAQETKVFNPGASSPHYWQRNVSTCLRQFLNKWL